MEAADAAPVSQSPNAEDDVNVDFAVVASEDLKANDGSVRVVTGKLWQLYPNPNNTDSNASPTITCPRQIVPAFNASTK
jgi:hypothetical protein